MQLDLTNRTALVLGATGGLGGGIAKGLAAEGVRVAIAGRNMEKLAALAAEIAASGGAALPLQWDLADLDAIEPNIASIEAAFGPVDILVNNTGGPPPTSAHGQPAATWETQFRAMVVSVIAITDRVLPSMRARRWGRIITSTSSGVVSPIPNLGMSNSLRLTLVGWSKTLAREVGRDGVTVNVVVPGRIATDRVHFLDRQKAERLTRSVDAIAAESADSIALGRYGAPEEYADAVTFLASARAAYITGTTLRVDGGMIASL